MSAGAWPASRARSFTRVSASDSLAATIPALAGMALGQRVRHRMSEATFRPVFFSVLLMLGAWLALRPLVA